MQKPAQVQEMKLTDFNESTQRRIREALIADCVQREKAKADREVPHTITERDEAPALGGAVQGEAQSDARVTVRFVGYRVRPLDPDNFAGSVKDLLDGLRHAGLLHGDEPWRIKLETEQVRVASFKEERTEIVLNFNT